MNTLAAAAGRSPVPERQTPGLAAAAGPAPAAVAAAEGPALDVLDDPLELGRFTRWVVDADGSRLGESSLSLGGITCAACAGLIEDALVRVPGVRAAQVSAAAQRAVVRWDPARTPVSALIAAIQRAGYQAVPDAAAPARELRRQESRQALWRLFVAGFCAMQVMMMATPSYVAGPGDLAPDMRQLLNWGSWLLTLPVLVFSSVPFFTGAWRSLRARRLGMDVPVALGIAITFIASAGATFEPDGVFGHEVYFDSLTMFVSFLLGSRYLEMRVRHRAAEALEASLARLPQTAWRLDAQDRVEAVSVHRLGAQDRVRVPAGEAFPADGILEQGCTSADESLLTGESVPVPKQPGDEAVAGSVNLGQPVVMRVQRVGLDTRFEAIVSMMRSAMTQRPAAARWADRWAPPFLLVVLLLAAGAAAVWSVIDPGRAIWVAVSVLIVTCPCALSLAAPAALVAATRGLAQRGVMLQRLDALEQLAVADRFFFDKTGTLTEDRLQLAQARDGEGRWLQGEALQPLLAQAASLASWSSHPVARALVQAAGPLTGPGPAWQQVGEVPGRGVQALDGQGRRWRLGEARWARQRAGEEAWSDGTPSTLHEALAGASGSPSAPAALPDEAARLLWCCDGQVVLQLAFHEALREDAADALQALRAQGARLTLLTGDSAGRAAALASRVGLDEVLAAATPGDKLAAVAQAQAQGQTVVMVGDGLNDAPVLARADVSLAMGHGALVSRGQADAVIHSNRLQDLVQARVLARKALRIVRQNLWWAASYNAVCIPLALVGWLPPWAAGLGMAGSSLLVILNATRAARP